MTASRGHVAGLPGAFVAIGVLLVILQAVVALHGCYEGDPGYGLPDDIGPAGIVETVAGDAGGG